MPRKPNLAPPTYCLHKASGRAVVRINGKDHYLGPYGSAESHAEYARLIAEWRVTQSELGQARTLGPTLAKYNLSIAQVMLAYREFAAKYYTHDGSPTKEFGEMGYALRPLRTLYGDTLARDFGPLKLKAIQQHMIDVERLSRGVINRRVKRIRRFFKWAVSEELVPANVSHAVHDVAGLRKGRTSAREAPPVKPVADNWVDEVLPHLSPQVAALVRLQRLTGMRPGEVVLMRACDIDMVGEVWVYEPERHKNEWRELSRFIPLGPKARQVLRPFLEASPEKYLFSPRDAESWRNERRAEERNPERKTKIYPSELRARACRKAAAKQKKQSRPKRERYDVDSYRRAITYAINKLNRERTKSGMELIPNWYPLQLRHSRATEVRKSFGIEAAQVSLGHARADVTEIYAERNLHLAIEVAQKMG